MSLLMLFELVQFNGVIITFVESASFFFLLYAFNVFMKLGKKVFFLYLFLWHGCHCDLHATFSLYFLLYELFR